MKRLLKVMTPFEFNHDSESLGEAMNADYEKAKRLAMETLRKRKVSEAIEDLIFNNNENMPTKILAVFLAGSFHDQRRGGIIIGKIDLSK